MRAFSYDHSYRLHRQHIARFWLMTLQYCFFTLAVACMIAIAWVPSHWIQAAVTTVLLLLAGAVCKSGRQ